MEGITLAPVSTDNVYRMSAGETVGRELKRRRTSLGYTQGALAIEAGVDRGAVIRAEKDDPRTSEGTILKLRSALEKLERRYGLERPDEIVNVIELPDGTRVRFTGSPSGVAEAAKAFLRDGDDDATDQ